MTQTAILGQLKSLTLLDRLAVIEDALRLIREELQVGQSLARKRRKNHTLVDKGGVLVVRSEPLSDRTNVT